MPLVNLLWDRRPAAIRWSHDERWLQYRFHHGSWNEEYTSVQFADDGRKQGLKWLMWLKLFNESSETLSGLAQKRSRASGPIIPVCARYVAHGTDHIVARPGTFLLGRRFEIIGRYLFMDALDAKPGIVFGDSVRTL